MEYGLQSSHDETLKFINRGHDFNCFQNAVIETKKRNIKVCAHIILGFPNENRKMMLETAKKLADLDTITVLSKSNIKHLIPCSFNSLKLILYTFSRL